MDRINVFKKIYNVKLQGASLVETIVATVLLSIVLVIALTSVVSVLQNRYTSQESTSAYHLTYWTYLYQYDKVTVPSIREVDGYRISFYTEKDINNTTVVMCSVQDAKSNRKRTKRVWPQN